MVFLNRLSGRRVNIKGNHDANNSMKTPIEKIYIRYGGRRICLVHNPKHADPYCELNFVGHEHNTWKVQRLNDNSIMVNVGVDVWDFKPVTYDEIHKRLSNWKRNEKNNIITNNP